MSGMKLELMILREKKAREVEKRWLRHRSQSLITTWTRRQRVTAPRPTSRSGKYVELQHGWQQSGSEVHLQHYVQLWPPNLFRWASIRLKTLVPWPLQCYRCLEIGHVRMKYSGHADRSGRCFCSKKLGHKALSCVVDAPKCPVCTDYVWPPNYWLGNKIRCHPKKKKGDEVQPRSAIIQSGQSVSCGNSRREAMKGQYYYHTLEFSRVKSTTAAQHGIY